MIRILGAPMPSPREQAIERIAKALVRVEPDLETPHSAAEFATAALDSLSPDLLLALALTEEELQAAAGISTWDEDADGDAIEGYYRKLARFGRQHDS